MKGGIIILQMIKLMLSLIKHLPDIMWMEVKEVESDPGWVWAQVSPIPFLEGMRPSASLIRQIPEFY